VTKSRAAKLARFAFILLIPLGLHAQQSPATAVFAKNKAALVTIATDTGFGSGVVVDSNGVIVTNLHVIRGASKASVRLADGDVYDSVSVVDFNVRMDLAVVRIQGFKLAAVELGDSDGLVVGEPVFAIGAPKGLAQTISEGIVSAVRDSGDGYRVVQTTAALSPGSSGGGLFDRLGRLIAVTTFRIKDGESLNFAVPINYARGMLSTTSTLTLEQLNARLDSSGSALAPARTSDAQKRVDPRIPIFVIAGGTSAQFTDPSKARQNSARDLISKLRDSKYFRSVELEQDAVVTIEVLARDTKREVNGWTAFNGAGQNKSTVVVRLIAGDFTTEFEGTSGSRGVFTGFGDAAGKIAKQLDAWASENLRRLQSLQEAK
jgi:trypsin-like peptidase